MNYTFQFDEVAMRTILSALSERPYKEVGNLLPSILAEATRQEQDVARRAPPSEIGLDQNVEACDPNPVPSDVAA